MRYLGNLAVNGHPEELGANPEMLTKVRPGLDLNRKEWRKRPPTRLSANFHVMLHRRPLRTSRILWGLLRRRVYPRESKRVGVTFSSKMALRRSPKLFASMKD